MQRIFDAPTQLFIIFKMIQNIRFSMVFLRICKFILATHTGSTNPLPTTSLDKDRSDSYHFFIFGIIRSISFDKRERSPENQKITKVQTNALRCIHGSVMKRLAEKSTLLTYFFERS